MEVEFFYISWEQVDNMIMRLAAKMRLKRVWGIPRGGSIVTTIMAFHGCTPVLYQKDAEAIVDDIADSGQTLHTYEEATAALVVRYGCDHLPDYWVTMIRTEDYILFPWEDTKDVRLQESFKTREG